MAEKNLATSEQLSISGANTKGVEDEDRDFEPTADMLVHDFDDEQTMEEEEMLQGETNFSAEIDDLTREGEMPLHELLKMYGYGAADSADSEDEGPEEQDVSENDQSRSAHGNTNKDREDEDQRSSSEESPDHSRTHGTAQLLCSEPCSYSDADADESEDEDYIPSEEWKKEVKVGPMYQAETPTELCKYKDNEKVYENEDQLLWNPELLPENEVVDFLAEASKRVGEQTGADAVPEMPLIKDNEEALYELIKCNFNKEEALKRLKLNPKPVKDQLPVWTEEERHEFVQGDEVYGTDFNSVQADKIKLWRRKPDLHPGVTDSTEQMLAEKESTEGSRAATAPTGASNCSSRQLDSEASSTTHNGAASRPVDPTSSCCSDRTTSDTQVHSSPDPNISSSNTDTVRRQREDEEDSERPVKKPKTEVELLTAAAV
ncbi:mesoderm induction early response protein 1a isoform X2 [Pangasianodon hypophthalmus]|uniref:mesoderm induction early response protein 1a isoform X2 n=1 Tax=Pangasianodon hypophthalmus TaxID=310915 RepID=UPI00230794F2|nr:mesoderm induction early response protein 1a isoform X2 [Pangasianodon hypophthalmus]